MPNYIVAPLRSKTGIQRDSTVYDSDNYVDGVWCRFYNGAPRKMGGYRALDLGNTEIVRNMFNVPANSSIDIYLGQPSSVGFINVTFDGTATSVIDRTPVSGFTPNPNNQWCFDLFIYSPEEPPAISYLVGHVAPNVLDITSTAEGPIFYGDIKDTLPLEQVIDTSTRPILCSGGVVYSAPVLVAYGNDGVIQWCNPNDITSWGNDSGSGWVANTATIANTKIIRAERNRGGASPSILFWTATSLINASYTVDTTGDVTTATFSSQTLADDITLLSPNCIIKYNQQFWWVGIDQFYVFNGIVQKMPNTMCTDFFFDELNYNYRSKTFGFPVPRYSELWWCYVRRVEGLPDSQQPTEPNHAVIYNIVENTWYDTPLNRSAGIPSTTFPYPVMADSEPYVHSSGRETYPVWQHERGEDKIIGDYTYPVPSYFQTAYMDLFTQQAENDVLMRVRRVEPDAIQLGEMTVEVFTRSFPQSLDVINGPFPFTGSTLKIDDVNCQGRLVSCRFTSDTLGGYYQFGHVLINYNEGDKVP